jgi:hypothetical protein
VKPGDLVRLVRKIKPYQASQMGENSELWYVIHPGEVGMLVDIRGRGPLGMCLFKGARVIINMALFEVVQ